MKTLFNRKAQKHFRQHLRNNMPEPEKRLWYFLRKRQIQGIKFRRQCSIGKYVVDFYSFDTKLAIEVDGDSHFLNEKAVRHDKNRQEEIESHGIRVLRFTNAEVMGNIEGCVQEIEDVLDEMARNPL